MEMDMNNFNNLLEDLDDAIDELEENLRPLTTHALTEEVSKLPLLDKAQLYVLFTYAIDSILFCLYRPAPGVFSTTDIRSISTPEWHQS